jgi:hypothetical protein
LKAGQWHSAYTLDNIIVDNITASLTPPGKMAGNPYQLNANTNKSFQGSTVLGMGFILNLGEAGKLIDRKARNKDVLFPYLNGEDLNSCPDQSPSRWVINFHDWPLEVAETYNDCMAIVKEKIRPERMKNNRQVYRDRWWHYAEKRPALYSTIADMERVLVIPRVSKYMICAWESTGIVYSEATVIIASEASSDFALIQCTFHDNWARMNGSTLETRMRYTPSDCFETFPFPINTTTLEDIGERYHTHRQSIMLARQEGLTKTYNRFHNPDEQASDIIRLRELHREMDEAVARAYGWEDLRLEHGIHETKQGLRYTISEAARREVLDRLLLLNHARHEQELRAGLLDKGAKKKPKGKGEKSGKGGKARDGNMSSSGLSVHDSDEQSNGEVAPIGEGLRQISLFQD